MGGRVWLVLGIFVALVVLIGCQQWLLFSRSRRHFAFNEFVWRHRTLNSVLWVIFAMALGLFGGIGERSLSAGLLGAASILALWGITTWINRMKRIADEPPALSPETEAWLTGASDPKPNSKN